MKLWHSFDTFENLHRLIDLVKRHKTDWVLIDGKIRVSIPVVHAFANSMAFYGYFPTVGTPHKFDIFKKLSFLNSCAQRAASSA